MLKVDNISKIYPRKAALKGVSLTLPDRGMVFIRGVSGSGKTTLMNILTAVDFPDGGSITYNGTPITRNNAEEYRRSCVSVVYQDFMLLDDMKVRDNIAFAMQAVGQSYTDDDIKELLSLVELSDCIDTKAGKLSGGEKQRVALARSVAKRGSMIFADEPTGNLDSGNAKRVMDILKRLSQDRLVAVVSHNDAQCDEYADYIINISDGEIASELTVNDGNIRSSFDNNNGFTSIKDRTAARTVFKLAGFNVGAGAVKSIVTTIAAAVICIATIVLLTLSFNDTNWAHACSLNKAEYKNVHINTDTTYNEVIRMREKSGEELLLAYNIFLPYDFDVQHPSLRPFAYINFEFVEAKSGSLDIKILHGSYPSSPIEVLLPCSFAKSLAMLEGKGDMSELVGDCLNVDYNSYSDLHPAFRVIISGIFDDGYRPYDEMLSYQFIEEMPEDIKEDFYCLTSNFMLNMIVCGDGFSDIVRDNLYAFYNTSYTSGNIVNKFTDKIAGYNSSMHYASYLGEPSHSEAYISRSYADAHNISVGDSLKWSAYSEGEFTVKDIFDYDGLTGADVILNNELYRTCTLRIMNSYNKSSLSIYHLIINAKGRDAYVLLNKLTKLNGINSSNIKLVNSFYTVSFASDIDNFLPFIIALAVVVSVGLALLSCASVNYQISSKQRHFNVLRAIGFGKKSISLVMMLQALITSMIQFIVGISLGAVFCHLISRSTTAHIATEITMPLGWHAALITFIISVGIAILTAVVKCVGLFRKSVAENSKL
ncbi:MAG: ATP-binding cassette domain-containing protein [Clostridia bacterium]|nr:ATP-binding cassette domain-containing protein [Clostridia bacterium]